MTAAENQKKEGGERIKINKKKPWGCVPEALVQDVRLGTTARVVGVWLCIRPPNWVVRRDYLLQVLGIGLDAWWRARRQLLQHGYLVENRERQGGRFTSAELEFFPEPAQTTAQGFTEPGKAEPGKAEPLPTTVSTSTNKPPPPPQSKEKTVVVVMDEIHWPAGLSVEQTQACGDALSIASPARRQALADELAGAMARCRPKVDNPPGWLRGLVKRELDGGAHLELAPGIASTRAARAAALAREGGGTITIAAPRPLASPAGPASLRQLAGRAAARQQLAALKGRPTPSA